MTDYCYLEFSFQGEDCCAVCGYCRCLGNISGADLNSYTPTGERSYSLNTGSMECNQTITESWYNSALPFAISMGLRLGFDIFYQHRPRLTGKVLFFKILSVLCMSNLKGIQLWIV